MATEQHPKFHVVMFPWLAMGHITPYLKLSNRFAEKGHVVSFLIPPKALNKISPLNLYPHLIHFIPITIPHVDGLPLGVETTFELPFEKTPHLLRAMDLTRDQVEIILQNLKPAADFIFFDLAHWVPNIANSHGISPIFFFTTAVNSSFKVVPRLLKEREHWTELDLLEPPEPYPGSSTEMPPAYQMKDRMIAFTEFNGQISLIQRYVTSMTEAKALCFPSCTELEGHLVPYLEIQYNKKVLLIGPTITKPPTIPLEEKWDKWLSSFDKGSVLYCALGSESVLNKDRFHELVLGLELTGFPFLARLNPPSGSKTVEEALPEGFEDRVKGRGVVHGGWLQQQLILNHPSVGCFMTHCGFGSFWESLASTCQLVLVPNVADQHWNAKFMAKGLKVGVEVERREEDGWFSKENVCKAVKFVMDESNEVGQQLRTNHLKWRDFLLTEGLESSYFDKFVTNLQDILK